MYIKDSDDNENFQTKLEIAYNEIIKPLKVPENLNCGSSLFSVGNLRILTSEIHDL